MFFSGLKIRVYIKLFFLFLNPNICCGYSKEPSRCDGSFQHTKHMLTRNDVYETLCPQPFACQKCQNLQRAITQKNKIIKKKIQRGIYSLSSISRPSLKLLAVIVFEISNFLCPNLQRAITEKKNFFKSSPGYLLIMLY